MTPRRSGQARPAPASDAPLYLAKAREYLRAAEDSLALGNLVAATGNAVHAGISAADAVAVARAGSVWKGEHADGARHVERVGGSDGREAGRHLRRLLPLKTRAEYDPAPVPRPEAATAVTAAGRLVAVAERVVASARPD